MRRGAVAVVAVAGLFAGSTRVLAQDVFLKRAPHALIEPVRLVEMVKGGYGYIVPAAAGKLSLMGLHGSELIAVEADGRPLFPFFVRKCLSFVPSAAATVLCAHHEAEVCDRRSRPSAPGATHFPACSGMQ